MNKIKLIAVTGGIGSGKTTVVRFIKDAGYETVSCDEITANLYEDQKFLKDLASVFPQAVRFTGEGDGARLIADKKEIAKAAFSDPEKYDKLTSAVTKKVFSIALARAKDLSALSKNDTVFVEVPLLFENGYETFFDAVIVVTRGKKERVAAVKNRSGLTDDEIAERIKKQFDYSRLPTGVIEIKNDKDLPSLVKATAAALEKTGLMT